MHHDRLGFTGLTVNVRVGVRPHERAEPRPVLISAHATMDVSTVARTDDPDAGMWDYRAAHDRIRRELSNEATEFNTMEAVAYRVIQICLETGAPKITVSAEKIGFLADTELAGVAEMTRSQPL